MNIERTTEEAVEPAEAAQAGSAAGQSEAPAQAAAKAPAKRPSRARRKPPVDTAAEAAGADTGAGTEPAVTETAAEQASAAAVADGTNTSADADAKPKRSRAPRRRASAEQSAPASSPAADPEAADVPNDAVQERAAEEPVKAVRRRRSPAKKPEAAAESATDAAPDAPASEAPAAGADGQPAAPAAEAEEPKAAPRTRTRRRAAAKAGSPASEAAETAPDAEAADAPKTTGDDAAADASAPKESEPAAVSAVLDPFAIPESPTSVLFHAPDLTAVKAVALAAPESGPEDDTDEDAKEGGRSRRSRRRSRGRTRTEGDDAAEGEDSSQATGVGEENADGVTSRRRRRRRRGDADLELTGGSDDDPPNTVTRVRAPRAHAEAPVSDRVTSVKGSTRLEAKKQRRRESRESGRRRHVITEAEFLARRESVDRQMIVRQRDDRIQIGVLEDGVLAEHFVSNTQQDSLIGNVYVGKVQNVLPSMEAAFVDIGRGRNAVLYAGEVNWDAAGLDGQPRRIELALKSGDSVLVQVTKDPVGHKGARLTSQISLPGRYLVYVPGGSMTGISRKLPDVERNRLKKILKDHLPQNAGVIVRTAAEGASEEELMNDINRLRAQWENIEAKAKSTKTLPPELLYGEPDLTIKVVRDVFNEDFSKLIVSGEEAWDTIEAYVTYVAPDLVGRLEKWTKDEDIFAASRIDEQIAKALDRKVFLPSGGSLVIDRTEAMTVVDVNTGKFTGSGGNLEETVTKNNLEAAEEVVRQLRLRDIGGIIVIDFIDMVLEANRDLVLRRLVECLGRDRTKHQVAEVTSLGLVQMTRKRMGTGLLEVFGEECTHCAGRGVITHDIPVEHRRSTSHAGHAVSEDNHSQHLKQEKQSRGERKRRNRNQNQQQPAPAAAEQAPAEETQPDERAAKAEAARAALATIAAAAAAAHGTDEAAPASPAEAPAEPAEKPLIKEPHDDLPAEAGAILRIQGETVVVPRRERRRPVRQDAQLTLESLTEAFNDVSPVPPAAEEKPASFGNGSAGGGSAADVQPVSPVEEPARRPRRRRAARSPQGAADAQIIKAGTDGPESAAQGSSTTAVAAPPAERPKAEASAPVILGVGVPASDL
ncbi:MULTISPECIES: Rne/Rng family ribonuclease [Arthrobacter]|uniref:Rne/Rng family ribonuclease n=1 Tax=Arthrobacter TaxID=1663 RepID=UPI001D1443A4|nr:MULTISPECIES: Rne/Rng family ribonuclease [Arthrobacter]MCC3282585.1 Rne/Rng family ribonuclease [Arthrobacter caoxuetaonis]MCC9193735.1 Rne/Rng family ribonuclease [Arthrobacter sp. zg-Y916]